MRLASHPIGAPAGSRVGRHVRRAAYRVGPAAATVIAMTIALIALAGPIVGAVAMAGGVLLLLLAGCRLIAAHEADIAEEHWLRRVLSDLDPRVEDDEDPDLLVS